MKVKNIYNFRLCIKNNKHNKINNVIWFFHRVIKFDLSILKIQVTMLFE